MKVQNNIRSVLAAELVLLVPLLAMAFSEDVKWTASDFIIAAILLAGVGVAFQLIISGIRNNYKLAVAGVVVAAAIALLWIEMAVGLFGSPIAGS